MLHYKFFYLFGNQTKTEIYDNLLLIIEVILKNKETLTIT